jgi:Tfp pilus assembly protein PilX
MKATDKGVALLMTVMAVALLSALVMGILQINTEEIQVVQNQVYAAQALSIAEAGLNDAFSELREDSSWTTGFSDKPFSDGSYTVSVSGALPNLTITSTGSSSQGFTARVEAEVTVGTSQPYMIRIDNYRINE